MVIGSVPEFVALMKEVFKSENSSVFPAPSRKLLTTEEACAYLSVGRESLRRFMNKKSNPLPSIGNGKIRRFEESELIEWLKREAYE